MSYPNYDEYKESKVSWADKIPSHWRQCAAKIIYEMQLGKMLQNDSTSANDVEISYLKALHVNWSEVTTEGLPKMWASPFELSQYEVQNGDLLVCEGGEVGRAAIVKGLSEPAIMQNALHRIRETAEGDTRYFAYLLRHIADSGWFAILCNKATIAHLTVEKLGGILMPTPPLPEQCQIASFLDWKTGQIDALIAKKRTLLDKLKEKRLAVITQAVTRGLNPKVPMRDSGIAWLRELVWVSFASHTLSRF
jgi:type I restriction enzyme, S subunit